jgi:hypothetical protein
MKQIILLILLFMGCSITIFGQNNSICLVKNGKPNMGIYAPKDTQKMSQLAIKDFIKTIERASGAVVEEKDEKLLGTAPKGQIKMIFGPSRLTDSVLGKSTAVQPEEFKIITKGEFLVILAKDIQRQLAVRSTMTTAFALGHIMENYMGVKWLWPGELGTQIPKTKDITIPEMNFTKQPKLVRRRFNLPQKEDDLKLWASYHRAMGERINYNFMHSFRKIGSNGDWWADFYEKKPSLLAQSPNGKPEFLFKDDFFKVCTSNPETVDEIVSRWQKAGAPDIWDVTFNDGNGWCCCDACQALDKKYGGNEYKKEDIWRGAEHVNLTERMVHFWNNTIKKMRTINPNAQITVFLYGRHKEAPVHQKLEAGILGEMVHGYNFEKWHDWAKAGIDGIGLRPNWWHMGANAPHLPLHVTGNYIKTAHKNRMTHLFMDSMNEYWATQGVYYYMVARLADNEDLSIDAIIDEYCSAFGKASNDVKDYIAYWEKYHEKVAYNIPAGGKLSVDTNGIYEVESRKNFKDVLHPLSGHWKMMPYIYTADVLDKANAILQKALKNANGDATATKRVSYLQDGLRHVALTIEYLKANKDKKETTLKAIGEFNKTMRQKYGYWNTQELARMKEWGLIGKEFKVDDY